MKYFLRLIRWQNLIFIFITQILFEYCVIIPEFSKAGAAPNLHSYFIYLLSLSSVLIAAGGNIINDYFDINIDIINKPDKLIIGKYIHRHWAILYHILLSATGVALGFWIEAKTHAYLLGLTNLACVVLLFFYSAYFKSKALSGNIIIALLTAWTVLVVSFCETNQFIFHATINKTKITRLTFLYAGFAFIISLIREMIKDMEDIEGDRKYGCRTFPIVFGVNASKIYSATWLIILCVLLAVMILYILQFRWWFAILYTLIFILIPATGILKKLFKTNNSEGFHKLSSSIKWLMLTGILSMIFLLIKK
ncbi:ubiquinone biosynthesis protein UbiA [Arachidicoccus ginsenosidimutans]|uniref:geranylgeranylglycerol-phosphate geranylgeranyltransferase n=1 Tax=Arachidicoccus sp. BS20 TaxID=1850526 RepID=UPI0007F04E90|nr:geranylgeranylglycerol-phosphate geranylgeranyltransferase [Arachidicoccus sp. BS20]ANI88354.1 ubiquinone biosynthesis protein UbiA [Arachidicoccus sp. BS20]